MQTPLATSVPNMIYRFTIKKVIAQKEGEIFSRHSAETKKNFYWRKMRKK